MWERLQNWWKYDRPASFWDWILDMDDDHWWFRPLVSILSSLAGSAIGTLAVLFNTTHAPKVTYRSDN